MPIGATELEGFGFYSDIERELGFVVSEPLCAGQKRGIVSCGPSPKKEELNDQASLPFTFTPLP
jgi:hypothetical protein